MAWIIDAQVLTELKSLNSSTLKMLQRTESVKEFLSRNNNTSSAIIAPKGFGKTLLLKLKRASLQDELLCLPRDPIVDRPSDNPPVLPDQIIDLLEKSKNWQSLWEVSFAISLLKSLRDDALAKELLKSLKESCSDNATLCVALENIYQENTFEVLHALLSGSRSDFFTMLDLAQHFTSAFRHLHRPVAVFVDNIDEYLESYIDYRYMHSAKEEKMHTRYLRMWHNGQIGAWLAVRRLHGINPHIKIFLSVRKEAYHYAIDHEPLFENLESFAYPLEYNQNDIVRIIEKNIESEPPSRLKDKGNEDPMIKFVGQDCQIVSNSGTGKQERILEYWLRHCTYRPRDAVSIGGSLSMISVEERTRETIRNAINSVAAKRAQSLFTEVMPFFEGLYPELLPTVIPSNVLSREQVEESSQKYQKIAIERFGATSDSVCHPFCALFAIGLVGVIEQNRDTFESFVQRFAPIGSVPFGSVNVLPKAETYVIHPSLSDYIVSKDVSFLKRMNRHNVVGDRLEWREEEDMRFVLIGDMKGYRNSIMNNPGASGTFEQYWSSLFRKSTSSLDYANTSSGDSFVLADRSPIRVLRTAFRLMAQLSSSSYALKIRIGGHCGFWKIRHDDDGVAHAEISDIVGVAARIEPLVQPGDIVVTEAFISRALEIDGGFGFSTEDALSSEYFSESQDINGDLVNISKGGKEEREEYRLYRVPEDSVRN